MKQEAENTDINDKRLLEARLFSLKSELIRVKNERDEFEKQFRLVVDSRSWKVTAPLRAFIAIKKIAFPLFKSTHHNLKLSVYRSLKQDGESYLIDGSTPTLDLLPADRHLVESSAEATRQDQYPPGWYSFDATVKTEKGTLFFFLYLGTDKGFTEKDRFLLSFDDSQRSRQPIYIHEGITSLRLEVYDFEGSFRIIEPVLKSLGSLNLISLLLSKYLWPLLKQPSVLFIKIKKAISCYREGGLWALRAKVFGGRVTNNYNEWVARFDSFKTEDFEKIKSAAGKLDRNPKISIITPVYNPPIKHFRLCLDSVLNQGYQNWELCLSDDCSGNPEVKQVIEEYKAKDSRIKSIYRDKSGHISAASNSALSIASGEYVAFLDHDDELTSDALFLVAKEINQYPDAAIIYSDEDKKTAYGLRINPHFKSDWNPELLLQQNYICHFLSIKKELVEKVGGLRPDFDGAQDWDLILRVSELVRENQIRHIPHILYHWTIIQSSTAQSTSAKPYVLEAQKKAVQEHLDRTGQKAKANIWHSISHISVSREVSAAKPKVSLIILTRDKLKVLKLAVNTILEKTSYKNYELIIVDNGSIEDETLDYLKGLSKLKNVKIITDARVFNFSSLNNLATKQASGTIYGFLNNDLEIIKGDWLDHMVAQAERPEVGAVGARLLFPNNLLQHGGVILGIGGVAGHNHKGRLKDDPGYFNRAILSQNLSAVTAACLLMRKDVFDKINGFDEDLSVAFNDVDLCLRIREAGYKIVYEPKAELYHHESASRGYENTPEKFNRFEQEIKRMKNRWKNVLINDPYYNPNLTNLSEDFVFAFPPRVNRAWK